MTLTEQEVYDRGVSPEHEGCLESAIHVEDVSTPCGDKVGVYMQVDSGIIKAMTHMSHACCLTKATMDVLCANCVGQPVSALIEFHPLDVVKCPISMGRRDCVQLPFRILRKLYEASQAGRAARP